MITRRLFTGSAFSAILLSGCNPLGGGSSAQFAGIERATGGRIGVAAQNLATEMTVSHRGDERFAMCSTFKWLLGALTLVQVDRGEESLEERVDFTRDDLVFYSPVLEPAVNQGVVSVGELCRAAITASDNTAANLLITRLGGPAAITAALRSHGDDTTRLDRFEPALNENTPGDPRDTSTPHAMLGLMRSFLFANTLSRGSRQQLRDWMIATETGFSRLRSGIPDGWTVGDKTGTSLNNANNDLGFALPPDGAGIDAGPILMVSYINAPNPLTDTADAVHADIARDIFRVLHPSS